jgi:hypothetical protein
VPGGTGVLTCASVSGPFIEPRVIFRVMGQAGLYRVIPDIIPFFQELCLIPDNAVVALCLPEGAPGTTAFINLIDAKSFDTVDNLTEIISSAIRMRKGLH